MKKKRFLSLLCGFLVLCMILSACGGTPSSSSDSSSGAAPVEPTEWTPDKPVTIVTYVAAGGGMDVSCRKFVQVAAKYTNATLIVENRTGAGGIIAQDYVLDQPADGYLIYGTTLSNIASIVSGEQDIDKYVWEFDWIAMIMKDPVAVIVTNESKAKGVTFDSIIEEAKTLGGNQIWVGPSTGGTKHIDAMKIWDYFDIDCTWVPFESGPLAMQALLSGQGVAATGNPFDTAGRDLWVAAVASEERLENYPDSPTFKELGYPELNEAAMWRGFAVKKGTPEPAIEWFQDICQKVTEDQEWIDFQAENGVNVVNYGREQFEGIVQGNLDEYTYFLTKVGLLG